MEEVVQEPVKMLHEIDFNIESDTHLILASEKGNIVKIKSLLKEGADVNAKDDNGNTGLIFASANSNGTSSLDIVELLINEGADVNAKNVDGWSSLMYAATDSTSSLDTVRLLLDSGADINDKNNDGWSSLMYASAGSDNVSSLDTVRLLLDRGADPFVKNFKNKYPLDLCPTESCKKIISTSMWKIMNNSIKKSAKWFSKQPEIPISKNVWELILLRAKQRQLCKDLNKEENKYVLQGFATMLNIPITENMTKKQLCNLVSKQLSQGRKLKTNKEKETDIIGRAKFLGVNTDQPVDKILDDISTIF